MSVQYVHTSGGDWDEQATLATSGLNGGDWTILCNWREDTDQAVARTFFGLANTGTGFTDATLYAVQTTDAVYGYHHTEGGTADLFTLSNATWYSGALQYTAETGGGGNGSLKILYSTNGTSVTSTQTASSLVDNTSGTFILGAGTGSGNQPASVTINNVKVYTSILTEAQIITEWQYNNDQLGTAIAHYKFASGALTTDETTTYTLTSTGVPAYTADEPSWILGDDPAAGLSGKLIATKGSPLISLPRSF